VNFLQLCQKVRRQGAVSGTGPASVLNQTGDYARIVEWVNDAWRFVQNERRWNWMWDTTTLATVADQQTYSAASDCDFLRSNAKCYKDSDGSRSEYWLTYMPYAEFHRNYLKGSYDASAPKVITRSPDGNLLLHPTPDDVYTVTYQYYRLPSDLSGNTDEPAMPERYHDLIVYKALQYLGEYEAAPGILQLNTSKYDELMVFALRDMTEEFDVRWVPLA